jgi:hypothetical protein
MPNKVCKKCGWALSTKDPSRKCPVCNTYFEEGICARCGEYKYDISTRLDLCSTCRREINIKAATDWRNHRKFDNFEEWLNLIKKVPKPIHTLTEDEWLAACRYFEGCAFCGSDSIDTRAMFIPFKSGGRYCDWNVVPQCQKCANSLAYKVNPFTTMNNHSCDRKRLDVIVGYLGPILERRINNE